MTTDLVPRERSEIAPRNQMCQDDAYASVLIFFWTNKRIGLNTTVHAPLSTLMYSYLHLLSHSVHSLSP